MGFQNRLCIIDTTLRDGEQSPDIAFSGPSKIELAKLLDTAGVYQIEAGIPAMGEAEKDVIKAIVAERKTSKIAVWNRMKPEDITQSIACAPDVIHISLPVSDLMLQRILKKDRQWAKKQIQLCALMALDRGFEVSVGFQDASRAEVKFMLEMATFLEKIGVQSIKLSDTIGLLTPSDTQSLVTQMVHEVAIDVGIHTHNDFGMAVANAISAVQAGAKTVDVTLYGIGERAGNCDAFTLLDAVEGIFETAPQRDAMKGIQLKADSLLFAAGGIRKWIDLSGRAL